MSFRVLLIQGGLGQERAISLKSAGAMREVLEKKQLPLQVVDAGRDLPCELQSLKQEGDVALLALHGRYGEDGLVQGICEYLRLPYTGSGVWASAMCMCKMSTKRWAQSVGVLAPDLEFLSHAEASVKKLSFPVVVKANRQGSSLGVSVVREASALPEAVRLALQVDRQFFVEEYIGGPELAVGVLEDSHGLRALVPVEIEPQGGEFFDYKCKYQAGAAKYYIPARVGEAVIKEAQKVAVHLFRQMGLRSYARVDFRVGPSERLYLIEVNTLPGFTATSLLPMAAQKEGMDFEALLMHVIKTAGLDYA